MQWDHCNKWWIIAHEPDYPAKWGGDPWLKKCTVEIVIAAMNTVSCLRHVPRRWSDSSTWCDFLFLATLIPWQCQETTPSCYRLQLLVVSCFSKPDRCVSSTITCSFPFLLSSHCPQINLPSMRLHLEKNLLKFFPHSIQVAITASILIRCRAFRFFWGFFAIALILYRWYAGHLSARMIRTGKTHDDCGCIVWGSVFPARAWHIGEEQRLTETRCLYVPWYPRICIIGMIKGQKKQALLAFSAHSKGRRWIS